MLRLKKTQSPLANRQTASKVTSRRYRFHLALGIGVLAVLAVSLMLRPSLISTAQEKTAEPYSEASSFAEASRTGIPEAAKIAPAPATESIITSPSEVCGWTAGTVYPVTILDQATVSQGSFLYTFGGVSTATIANARKFDGTTWTDIAPLPAALEFPTAVSDGTYIYVLGGALVGTGTPQTTVYRYDPTANTYATMAPFTTGTWNQAVAYLGGKIYKFAGTGPATASTNVLEIYDVAGNTWTAGAPYPLLASFVSSFVHGGHVYGAGGIQSVGNVATLKTYRYDTVANTWDDVAIADLPLTRWGAASSATPYGPGASAGWVLAGGYENGTATANITANAIRWNPTSNTWSAMGTMPGERARMTGAQLGGSFYVIGGRSVASSGFVGTNSNHKLACIENVAVITAGTATVTSGNNLLEPNECNTLDVPLSNAGDVGATAISAVLSTTTPGITVTQPNSAYPNIPAFGGPTNNSTPYQVSIDNTVACFTSANFTLTVTYTGGSSPGVFNFSLPVGIPGLNYESTTQTGQTIPAGGTFIPLSDDDDFAVTVPLPVGWTSTVYGVPVTSLSASTNGNMTINGAASTTVTNTAMPAAIGGANPTLLPYWDDLDMDVADVTGGGIFHNTVGTTPNRQFYVEWRAQHYSETANGPITTNFAILLTEGSDVVRYVYVLTGLGTQLDGLSATVGIQRQSTGTQFTQFSFNTASLSAGLQITYTRPAGQCTPGSGTCGASIKSRADFDGDGKTDVSIFRPSEGNWYMNRSTAGFGVVNWGVSTDTLIPADYDGDGKADFAIWRPSDTANVTDFFVLNSTAFTVTGFSHGLTTDTPVTGDFDGDGKSDIVVWRPSTGTWYVWGSLAATTTSAQFGLTGDIPMAIDNDGDGKANFAVLRPGNNTWYIAKPTGVPAQNFDAIGFGAAGDVLVPADYDGDNKDDVAVFRPSNGVWYIRRSTDSGVTFTQFGQTGDVAVPGDYDGDGKDDVAVYRAGIWYLNRSTSGFSAQTFGLGTDKPVPGAYHP